MLCILQLNQVSIQLKMFIMLSLPNKDMLFYNHLKYTCMEKKYYMNLRDDFKLIHWLNVSSAWSFAVGVSFNCSKQSQVIQLH